MTAINTVVDLAKDGEIAVVTVNSPPVNALSADVRDGLAGAFAAIAADPAVKAAVKLPKEISEETDVSNSQMMKGSSKNMMNPLMRCRIETIPAAGKR